MASFASSCRNISYPSSLPQVSIIFIFVNEALSVILRSVHSAIHRTPSHLLKEIILVDDNSNNGEMMFLPRRCLSFNGDVRCLLRRGLILYDINMNNACECVKVHPETM